MKTFFLLLSSVLFVLSDISVNAQVEIDKSVILTGIDEVDRRVQNLATPKAPYDAVNAQVIQSGVLYYGEILEANANNIVVSSYLDFIPVKGSLFNFQSPINNIGEFTLVLNNLPPAKILKYGIFELDSADIQANQMVSLIFDGVNWQMINPNNFSNKNTDISEISGDLLPDQDNSYDIGGVEKAFKDFYFDGKIYLRDSLLFEMDEGHQNFNFRKNGAEFNDQNPTVNQESNGLYSPNLAFPLGSGNLLLGYRTGNDAHKGSFNHIIGVEAGAIMEHNTYFNTFLGFRAGYKNRTGSGNLFIGSGAGRNNNNGHNNIFIGNSSGYENDDGAQNLYLGHDAGSRNISGLANTFLGMSAGYDNLADENVFIGFKSGFKNTVGEGNTFIGFNSGYNNKDGNFNTFIGYEAGYNTDLGVDENGFSDKPVNNLFVGYQAGYHNDGGFGNTFIGNKAGYNITTSFGNIYIGPNAGYENNGFGNTVIGLDASKNHHSSESLIIGHLAAANGGSGSDNLYIGNRSAYENSQSDFNHFVGNYSGHQNTTGEHNHFTGYRAGFNNTTGHHNTLIGYEADVNSPALNNSAAIGYQAKVNVDNGFVLGNNTNLVGIRTSSPAYPLDVHGDIHYTGNIINTSDQRFKTDIQPLQDVLEKLNQINGVKYYYDLAKYPDKNFSSQLQIGVIAQEVEKVYPELVFTDSEGFKSVDYAKLTPLLLEAIKNQQSHIQSLEKRFVELEKSTQEKIEAIEKQLVNSVLYTDNQ